MLSLPGKDFWQTRGVARLNTPNMTLSDGPHSIRKQEGAGDQLGLNGSLPATCYPTAATIANSWDPALGEEIGAYLGAEAAAQELRRMASDSVMDERILREIYLTGFEIAVKEGKAKFAKYFSGDIKNISDAEFAALLGRPIPDGHWSGTLDMNDAICQLYYAKSGLARFVYRRMANMLNKSIEKGEPDLNITFIYNSPRIKGKLHSKERPWAKQPMGVCLSRIISDRAYCDGRRPLLEEHSSYGVSFVLSIVIIQFMHSKKLWAGKLIFV